MVHVALYSPDPRFPSVLASALQPEYRVVGHSCLEQLKLSALSGKTDVVVLDFDSNHATIAEQLAFYDQLGDLPVPVVVMTDDTHQWPATTEFLLRGAFDCIRKPPSLVEFKIIVRRANEHALMQRELERIRGLHSVQGCDKLVGTSGRAQLVYDLIRRVANLNASVLITGESGTGKELVANALHNLSNRAREPFVAVSCGAIPETLIEAELFGHEKGAFTGSTGSRAGYLEQAGNGTLFLDEIGELSPGTQVKLLRVLQQKVFTRLGSNKLIPLRARVVFATHRNLQQMVEAGSFRQDLYFRVNVMPIAIPALRDRTEDIPTLARHFLRKYAAEYEKPVNDIRPNAMELLVDYEWPGNIRELENVIQGAVILTDGGSITRADLPDHIQQLEQDAPLQVVAGNDSGSFEDQLWQFKVGLANKAVSECSGNKSLAARRLRVSRAYLHRLIRMNSPESSDAA